MKRKSLIKLDMIDVFDQSVIFFEDSCRKAIKNKVAHFTEKDLNKWTNLTGSDLKETIKLKGEYIINSKRWLQEMLSFTMMQLTHQINENRGF